MDEAFLENGGALSGRINLELLQRRVGKYFY